jgi:hypothetical protein
MPNSSVLNDAISSSVVPATEERRGGKKFRLTPRSGKNQSILKTQTSEMGEKVEVEDSSFYNKAQEKVKNWESELPEEPPSTESPRVMNSDCDGGASTTSGAKGLLLNPIDCAMDLANETAMSITLKEYLDLDRLENFLDKTKKKSSGASKVCSKERVKIEKIKKALVRGNIHEVTYKIPEKFVDEDGVPNVGRLTPIGGVLFVHTLLSRIIWILISQAVKLSCVKLFFKIWK